MSYEIDYNLADIDDNNELLRQICARLDRHFPDAEQLKLNLQLISQMNDLLNKTADDLAGLGLNEISEKVKGMVVQ